MGCTSSKSEVTIQKKNLKKMKLSEKELKLLAKETNFSREEIKDIFEKFMEKTDNGVLNKKQFAKLYSRLRPESHKKLNKLSQHVFNAFDKNHDGSITFKEFMLSFGLTSRGDLKTKLEYAFDCYDADGNGMVETNELIEVLNAMVDLLDANDEDSKNTAEIAKKCIEDLDTSKDFRISKEEFINGLMGNFGLRSILNPFN